MNIFEQEALRIEDVIGYSFGNKSLLIEALSHSSYVNEQRKGSTNCYERLEFLGDAVLELASSTFLFHHCPELNEGELSKLRAALVCEKALAPCARKIQLGSYILLGHGEKLNHGEERDSLLCDVMEAIIGAIYTDAGLEEANRFIFSFILTDDSLRHLDFVDYKTKFQELVQAHSSEPILYEIVGTSGPDHSKQFEVEVRLGERTLGRGVGSSRKNAEQDAAREAINILSKGWT
ncbi:MAG: ribonuclease III [Lachnospiraceae bacterium]|nr:ribonuclease III [Lachnospiraceae bacterium]MBO4559127.1 ribonuclease III [Lachnospiraceae bacterium]MBR5732630.1 ribonuclease III [Lachnospiraceae bacterium]